MAEDATIALVTTAAVKTFLDITSTSEDSLLDTLVNSMSKAIATFCGRKFVSETFTEYYDGSGLPDLILKNYPIISVTSLNIDGSRVFDSVTDVTVADNVIIDNNAGIITLWRNYSHFPKGLRNVKVVYVAGYATIPVDVQHAAKLAVQYTYKRHYTDQKIGISSESVGDKTTTFDQGDLPRPVKLLLDPYRKKGTSVVY